MFRYCNNVSKKLDGDNVGTHELFTPSELVERRERRGGDGDVQQSSYTRGGADKRKLLGGAARWTAVELDGQLNSSNE